MWSSDNERDTAERGQRSDAGGRASSGSARSREPDPNSPFAKLAALKAQLEGPRKG
jgi:hypothetical protein